jgi:hypothetical protein
MPRTQASSSLATATSGLSKPLMTKLRIPDSGYLDFVKRVANQIIGQDVSIEKQGEHKGKVVAILKPTRDNPPRKPKVSQVSKSSNSTLVTHSSIQKSRKSSS